MRCRPCRRSRTASTWRSINWCLGGYHEAAAGRPPGANRLIWRAARAFTLGLERFTYRPPRTRLAEVETPAAKATVERHYPGLRWSEIPLVYDTERYRPDPEAREEVRAELGVAPDDVVALHWAATRTSRASTWRWRAWRTPTAAAPTGDPLGGGHGRPRAVPHGSHGVEDHVKRLGYRRTWSGSWRRADIFVLPTIYEHGSRALARGGRLRAAPAGDRHHGPAALIGDDEGGIVIERDPARSERRWPAWLGTRACAGGWGRVARERMLAPQRPLPRAMLRALRAARRERHDLPWNALP